MGVITIVDEHTKVVRFAKLNDYFSFSDKEVINEDAVLHEFSVEIEDKKTIKISVPAMSVMICRL